MEDLAQLANTPVDSQPQGIFNLGTGVETSVATLAAALADLSGISQSEIRRVAAIAGEQRRSCLSSAKAQRELGFRIATPLAEGLAATFAWCKTQK